MSNPLRMGILKLMEKYWKELGKIKNIKTYMVTKCFRKEYINGKLR